jgi:hypothetical protein
VEESKEIKQTGLGSRFSTVWEETKERSRRMSRSLDGAMVVLFPENKVTVKGPGVLWVRG